MGEWVLAEACRQAASWPETDEQAINLKQLGCHLQQGHLFARPLPATQFIDWLKNRH